MSAVSSKTRNVGVLRLTSLVRMFYEAGFWIAQAQASHIEFKSAYSGDAISRLVGWAVGTGYNPQTAQTMEVVTDPISENIGGDLLIQFLTILYEKGPVAAQDFAGHVQVRRTAAIHRLLALDQIASEHDRALARQATLVMQDLTTVMHVCGILFAVGTCVLSLGVLPAVIAGGDAATQGAAAYLLSNTSSAILAKIRSTDDPKAMDACAVDFTYGNKTFVAGYALDKASEHYKEAATTQLEIFKRAQRHVAKLQVLQGKKITAWQKARVGVAKISPQIKATQAQFKGSVFKGGQYAMKGGSVAFALIQLRHDLIGEAETNESYEATVHQGNDN